MSKLILVGRVSSGLVGREKKVLCHLQWPTFSHMCCSPGCLASDPAFPVPTTGPPDVSLHPQGSLSPCPALKPWMPPLPAPHSPQPSLHPHRQAPLLAMVSPPPCLHSCPQGDQRGGLNPLPLVCVAELPGLLQLQTTQPTLTG